MEQDTDEVQRLGTLLEQQREAFLADGPPSAEIRQARLQRVIDMLVACHEPLVEAIDADFGGRQPAYSTMNDVLGSLAALKFARDSVASWMEPDPRPAYSPYDQVGATAYVLHQPKGTVGIIGTWNAPIYTLLAPLAYALAGGNRAVLKPSEIVPRTAKLLAEIAARHLDPLEVAVITGGPEVASGLSSQPLGHLVFTGSGSVGKLVMANAAENLVPVTLELGGKSPSVVSRSADLALAAGKVAVAKATNGGQLCVNADLVYVPREQLEAFVTELKDQYAQLNPTVVDNPDVVAVVNERHLARLHGYVSDAVSLGARVEVSPGGETVAASSRRQPLHIVVDPAPQAQIMQEEIFGPAVVVLGYDTLDDALADINARPNPLALYYFGTDEQEKQTVLERTRSGGVTVNGLMLHPGMSQAPFGGVGASGMGHYNGREGFLEFTHARTVFEAPEADPRREWGMLPPHDEHFLATMRAAVTP